MYKVIITGATGMVGKGVLLECLDHHSIQEVLVVTRRSLSMQHDKLKEIILADFTTVESIREQLNGYDACFFCMGVSAVGKSEETYANITFAVTKLFADLLFELNPNMVFNYVSGQGTDSSEKGRIMWARVKGKTENYVLNKGFKDAYAFRPGIIIPERGIKSNTTWYELFYVLSTPFYGWLKRRKNITTTSRLGLAMINSISINQALKHLDNKDINQMAEPIAFTE